VRTGRIDLEALRRDRDQLWAEAAHLEAQGASITLPEELWEAASLEQGARLEEDPWLERLSGARGEECGDVVRVSTQDLFVELGIPAERQTQGQSKRIAHLMRRLGWRPAKFRFRETVVRGYERPKPAGHSDKPRLS
jgi:predicted P-loop ATPase